MLTIKTMKQTLSKDQVIEMLKNMDNKIKIEKIDALYYPYTMLIFSIILDNKFKKFDRKFMCNVDLVQGRPAIGQGRPSFIVKEVEKSLTIDPLFTSKGVEALAHDYVLHMFIAKMKILLTPNITLESSEEFHKLFYITQCKDLNDSDYFLLVDAMNGSFTILDY